MQNYFVKDIVAATGGTLLCGDPDTKVSAISIDSRDTGNETLFVPIIGERVDAHKFMEEVDAAGIAAMLTSEHDSYESRTAVIRVTDTVRALQAIGLDYGARLGIPKIGVTGSVGKTTTKEMIACALSAGYRVFKTPGNSNGQVGVPITLSKIESEDEIAVVEMGISMPGEMSKLSTLLTLDTAVATNIGVSHIENLGSQDGICREKFHIQDALNPAGVMFLNGDDEVMRRNLSCIDHKIMFYGFEENNDYRAVDINCHEDGSEFTLMTPDKRTYPARINVPGVHNIRNALVAIAVACRYRISVEAALEALLEYRGTAGRQDRFTINGIKVIDDSYNASPDSMKAGLDVLNNTETKGRKIAVLADMLELGSDSPRYHYEVGEYIKSLKLDEILLFGELAANIGKGAADAGIKIQNMADREEINAYLAVNLRPEDAVLFKGSRGMKLDECVKFLKEINA